ncbi:MAG TPA: hypothetical protein PKD86_10965 [Gemmatales bacterium]|nr:hypothetical protein [Gemmatales bacterium]HMP59865.1 hypothetical protein [Gemmatales bacterium]
MNPLFLVWFFLLLQEPGRPATPPEAEPPAAQPTPPATPAAAVQALKRALESHDLAALAELTQGNLAGPLRSLAGPFAKARTASERLDQVIKDKPALAFTNPFAPSLQPFAQVRFEVLEVVQDQNQHVARIRFGRRGLPLAEEQLAIHADGNSWRLELPSDLRKQVESLIGEPALLQREQRALDALATIFTTLATEIEKGQLASKGDVVARMLRLMDETKLSELYERP